MLSMPCIKRCRDVGELMAERIGRLEKSASTPSALAPVSSFPNSTKGLRKLDSPEEQHPPNWTYNLHHAYSVLDASSSS